MRVILIQKDPAETYIDFQERINHQLILLTASRMNIQTAELKTQHDLDGKELQVFYILYSNPVYEK